MNDEMAKKELPATDKETLHLARKLGEKLKQSNLMMATAESCTGGGIASALTEIPGSSQWFMGALVTYSNDWKRELLGVRESTLAAHGAVSQQVVLEMLDGLMGRFQVQAGLAISGIAGPGGAVPGKPVGTVFIGAAYQQERRVQAYQFTGDRSTVRKKSVIEALQMMQGMLSEKEEDSL